MTATCKKLIQYFEEDLPLIKKIIENIPRLLYCNHEGQTVESFYKSFKENLQEFLGSVSKVLDKLLKLCDSENSNISCQNNNYHEELSKAQKEISALQTQVDNLTQEIKLSSSSTIEMIEIRNLELSKEIENDRQIIDKQLKKISDLESQNLKSEESSSKMTKMMDRIMEQMERMERKQELSDQKIEKMSSEKTVSDQRIVELEKIQKTHNSKMDTMKREHNHTTLLLRNEINQLKTDLSRRTTDCEETVAKNKRDADLRCANLQRQIDHHNDNFALLSAGEYVQKVVKAIVRLLIVKLIENKDTDWIGYWKYIISLNLTNFREQLNPDGIARLRKSLTIADDKNLLQTLQTSDKHFIVVKDARNEFAHPDNFDSQCKHFRKVFDDQNAKDVLRYRSLI